mgnify:FL=1
MTVPATKQAIVYQATNRVNGKRYIGYTARGLAVRRSQHFSIARKGGGNHFQNALRKHGEDNFSFVVLGEFGDDEELAKVYEIEAIAKYRPEYNLSYGGEGGTLHESSRKKIGEANSRRVFTDEMRKNIADANRGSKRSDETRAKMRAAQIGRKHSAETIQKMREVCGHPVSDEARKKMSIARQKREPPSKGKKWSAEARLRISTARKGRPAHNKGVSLTEEHKQKIRAALKVKQPSREALSKPVKCLTDGRVFVSANEADRFYGLPLGSASRFARGQNKSKQGFRFEYVVKK